MEKIEEKEIEERKKTKTTKNPYLEKCFWLFVIP